MIARRGRRRRGGERLRPAPQRRLAEPGQPIPAGRDALEPAVSVAQQNPAGIGRGLLEIARPAGTRQEPGGAGERPLAIGGHDWPAGRAAKRRIAPTPRVLAEKPPTPLV